MPNYTQVNLRDVEDQAPKFGMPEGIQARFAREALGLEKSGVSFQRLAPGVRMPFGHAHAEQEELYVVIRGNARVKVGDEVLELSEMDALRVDPDVVRAFEGGADGAEILAFGAPAVADRGAEAKMHPGWWEG